MTSKTARTRWSELPKWAWAHGLRKNVHFRAPSTTTYEEAAAELPDTTTDINDAQVITSLVEYHDRNPDLGMHRPILDIDFPAQLIPSSTPGHFHLYLDKPMPWRTYAKLLRALAEAEIIEPGYARASEARKYTAVRLPWISKEDTPDLEPTPAEDDQPEVELVDRVADEAFATLPAPQAPEGMPPRVAELWPHMTPAARTQALRENTGWASPQADPLGDIIEARDRIAATPSWTPLPSSMAEAMGAVTAAIPANTIPRPAPANHMSEPLEDDPSRMRWASPHRTISYNRLRSMFGHDYHELLTNDPTTGNPLWREACRQEQRRDNLRAEVRRPAQERIQREVHEAMEAERAEHRRAQEEGARRTLAERELRQEQLDAINAPRTWTGNASDFISGRMRRSEYQGFLRPRSEQNGLVLTYHDSTRIIRDNRGRQLTHEDFYRAMDELRLNHTDLEGSRMEENWERVYGHAMSRRSRLSRPASYFRPGEPTVRDAVLANLQAAYAPTHSVRAAAAAEDRATRDRIMGASPTAVIYDEAARLTAAEEIAVGEALEIANGPSEAPSLADTQEDGAE